MSIVTRADVVVGSLWISMRDLIECLSKVERTVAFDTKHTRITLRALHVLASEGSAPAFLRTPTTIPVFGIKSESCSVRTARAMARKI